MLGQGSPPRDCSYSSCDLGYFHPTFVHNEPPALGAFRLFAGFILRAFFQSLSRKVSTNAQKCDCLSSGAAPWGVNHLPLGTVGVDVGDRWAIRHPGVLSVCLHTLKYA